MGATFTRPLPFTVVTATQSTIAPAANANDDRPGKVWRVDAAGASYVVIDLGLTQAIDTVALLGSNLVASDTWRVRTGATNTGIGSYDSGVLPAFTGTRPAGFSGKSILYLTQRSDRYLRIDITSAAPLEVQRLVIGSSITTAGIDWEADQAMLDTSNIESNLGADVIVDGAKKIRWKVKMSMLDATQWRGQWLGFLAQVGKRNGIMFNPFAEDPSSYQSDAIFGRIRNDVSGTIPGGNLRVLEMTIEGLAL